MSSPGYSWSFLVRSKRRLCFLGVTPGIGLTFVNMIGLSQWRAVIGHWNSCRIRQVNARPLSNTSRSPYKPFVDIESGDCSLGRVPPDPPIASINSESAHNFTTSQVQDDSLPKRSYVTVSGDTMCRLVTLMLYLLFLLLLSGDVELNPGPITAEQGNSLVIVFLNCIQFVHR